MRESAPAEDGAPSLGLRLRNLPTPVRVGISAGILVLLLAWLGPSAIVQALTSIHPGWVGLAMAVTLLQVALLGWRWQVTARRLGLVMGWREAAVEYYRAIFLNQVLPGGVVGDVSRAWRHARSLSVEVSPTQAAAPALSGVRGVAVRAVILERASAQVLMTGWGLLALGVVVVAAPIQAGWDGGIPGVGDPHFGASWALFPGLLLGAVLLVTAILGLGRRWALLRRPDSLLGRSWNEAKVALLSPSILPFQLATGILLVASYLGVFVLAGQAVGVSTPGAVVALLAAPVLLAMLLPVSWAGWGVREAGAAGLWTLAGFPATDGVLVSVAYGTLVLVTSLPAGLLLLRRRPGMPT